MSRDSQSPEDRTSLRDLLRRAFVTGTALMIPLVLTLVVLQIALDLVSQAVAPVVAGFELVFGDDEAPQLLIEAVTVATLCGLVLIIGLVAERTTGQGRFSAVFDDLMARIPGLGSVYTGTRRMSEVILEQDTQAFQEVKLVEFPREGTFSRSSRAARRWTRGWTTSTSPRGASETRSSSTATSSTGGGSSRTS